MPKKLNDTPWSSVGDNKEVKILHDGKLILLKPNGFIVPLFCEVCNSPMRTIEDTLSYRVHNCCHHCAMQWADSAFYKWSEGWRPTHEQIQKSLSSRNILKPILFT